jgi:hypothetical protein
LLGGMVVEDQLSTGGAPRHAEPGHFDGVGSPSLCAAVRCLCLP